MGYYEKIPNVWLSYNLLLLQILLVIEYRQFKPFAFFIFFALTYTIPPHLHFYDEQYILTFGSFDFSDMYYYRNMFILLSIFWSAFTIVLPRIKNPIVLSNFLQIKNNAFIFYSTLAVFALIIFLGRTGQGIAESGGYAQGGVTNAGGMSLYEYGGLLYLIAFTFSGLKKSRIIILLLLGGLFCVNSLIYGIRGNTLFMMLLMFILHLDKLKISFFKWVLMSLPLIFAFIAFGVFRQSTKEGLDLINSNLVGFNEKYLVNPTFFANQVDVFYASTRLFGMCDIGEFTPEKRVQIFIYNILAFVVPYSKLPEIANIVLFKADEYHSGGGALIIAYFYVFLSYYGVVLIALVLGLIFRRVIKKPENTPQNLLVYIIIVLSIYITWYGYSSNNIYKFCVYAVIAYSLANFVYKQINTGILKNTGLV